MQGLHGNNDYPNIHSICLPKLLHTSCISNRTNCMGVLNTFGVANAMPWKTLLRSRKLKM